jgi:hypothetical protein
MIMSNKARHAVTAATLLMIISGSTAATGGTKPPTVDPSHGGKDAAWRVIAPPLFPVVGGPAPTQPPCHASDITAHAVTRVIPGGVAGIVHLRGDQCSITSKAGPDELRSGDTTLNVASTPWNEEPDPLSAPRSDIPLAAGHAVWSFTWTGSFCGSTATSIVTPLTKKRGDVVAPLSGPQPGCEANPSATPSVLTPGAPVSPHQPSMPPGGGWSDLTAHLSVKPVIHQPLLRRMTITLTNPTDTDITLAPCPTYSLAVGTKHWRETPDPYQSALPCAYQARVVTAHQQVVIPLHDNRFDIPRFAHRHRSRLTVTWAVLDVPQAVAHTRFVARR